MPYKAPHTTHALASLILGLSFHNTYPDRFRDTVNIFLSPDLSLPTVYKTTLVVRSWDTTLDRKMMTTYVRTVSLLQLQCIAPIERW